MANRRISARKGQSRPPSSLKALPDDLRDSATDPAQDVPRPRRKSPPRWYDNLPVIDDWPEHVPVTLAEVQVFERWFGDVFDELFSGTEKTGQDSEGPEGAA